MTEYEVSGPGSNNRQWYEIVKAKYPQFQPSLGCLRQERVLKNNQSQYVFDFKSADPSGNSRTEQLLAVTDSFGANTIMLGIIARQKSRPSAHVLMTYPSQEIISGAFQGSTADNPTAPAIQAVKDLETIYNGVCGLQIATNSIFDGLDTRRFRYVPATQQGVFASKSQARYLDGAVAIEPKLFIDGTQASKLTVTVPTFDGMAIQPDNADFELVLVLIASGFRVQGASDLKASR